MISDNWNTTLLMTVGLPRSGKSTWAKATGLPMVNPDSIRLALYERPFIASCEDMVWTITKYMVKALFIAGHHQVILDATNIKERDRRNFYPQYNVWEQVNIIVFRASRELCEKRARQDRKDELLPVIERMSKLIDWPDIKLLPKGVVICSSE